jgi:antitoxin component YwqK of YwqJK toxin-antitoxin module
MNLNRIISAGALLLISSRIVAQAVREVVNTPNAEHAIYRYNNIARVDEESKPFTGKFIDKNSKGEKMSEHNYVNGKLEGKGIKFRITYYHPAPFVEEEAYYKNDKLHGKYLKYDIMGDEVYVSIEANYKNGILHGHYIERLTPYFKSKECYYVNGELDGKWISYSTQVSTGIDCIQYYKLGQRDSISIWFHPNGKPERIEHYNKKGEDHGLRQEFYEDGTIKSEINYVNDSKHGQWKEYYENGKLARLTNYANGRKHGQEKVYYINGALKRLTNFVNDEENGEETLYYETGKIKEKKHFKMGTKTGKWTWHDEDGNIKEETEYRLN